MAKTSTAGKTLVVVESPTKAKTIRKFLGKEYIVESCMGHVRDLPQSAKDVPDKFRKEKWAHLGVNVENEFEPVYCIPKAKTRIVKDLKDKLLEVDQLILATDEDREGESISWHLVEVLRPKVPVKRMVFHEITKTAIENALKTTRDIDLDLVRAQEARRILDRLVGYTISPLLWKKVAYGLSAGRVQSVAVRLIAEREHARIRFHKAQYWSVNGVNKKDNLEFETRIVSYKEKRVAQGKDFDSETGELRQEKKDQIVVLDQTTSQKLIDDLKGKKWTVSEVEEKPVSRKPSPPFITSTLQQEANRKLGLSSRETMEFAQKLYERGFITYMRTDSTNLSQQAITAARECIQGLYGKDYLPEEPRDYTSKKSKGAQEAHEAIRPAGTSFQHPDEAGLSGTIQKVYELIWMRTVASQMVNARQKQVSVKFEVGDALFSTSGMTIEFPGFLKAYVEGFDDPDAALDNREIRLPNLKKGDQPDCLKLKADSHETKPPARFTEATLVQTMEKEGIGRPSTYAAIISTVQHRGYVKKVGNALVPTFTALVVSKLLSEYLPNYVDTHFTSTMEQSLDDIAQGELNFKTYLNSVYFGGTGLKEQVEKKEKVIDDATSRSIQLEGLRGLIFRIGRYGAYVCRKEDGAEVCASLPDSQFPGDISADVANKLIDQKVNGTDALGKDPVTGLPVYVLSGRYGPYVQLGESENEGEKVKPKRMAIPPTMNSEEISLEQSLQLLSLPKLLGNHPESQKEIKVGLGRFGPYVVHDGEFRSIPKTESLFTLSLARALELLAQPKKMRGRSQALKELGKHPVSQEDMAVFTGKYGPYIKCGKVNVSLPDDVKPEDVTEKIAVELLSAKMGAAKPEKKPKKAASKPRPTKSAASVKAVKAAVSVDDSTKKVLRRKAASSEIATKR